MRSQVRSRVCGFEAVHRVWSGLRHQEPSAQTGIIGRSRRRWQKDLFSVHSDGFPGVSSLTPQSLGCSQSCGALCDGLQFRFVTCRGQRRAMDPGCEVAGRALGDAGGVSRKFVVAEELTPLPGRSGAEELVPVVVEAVVAGLGYELAGPALHVLEGGGLDQVRPEGFGDGDPEPAGYVAHLPFEVIQEGFIAQQHDVRLVAYLAKRVQMVKHDLQVGDGLSGRGRIDPGPEALVRGPARWGWCGGQQFVEIYRADEVLSQCEERGRVDVAYMA